MIKNNKCLNSDKKPFYIKFKKAFTLTELLIALTVVGVVAILTIPRLMSNIHNKILVNKLKANVTAIQQLIAEQKIQYKTQNLKDTDFNSASTLFTSSNFNIVKHCSAKTAATDCWKNVSPRAIESVEGNQEDIDKILSMPQSYETVILKNGATLSYAPTTSTTASQFGTFTIDVNGSEEPNILGRDIFWFSIYNDGSIAGTGENKKKNTNVSEFPLSLLISGCEFGASPNYCYEAVVRNGWVMPY